MIIDFAELMKQEEMLSENLRKADDMLVETLRQRAFPTPSPFGVEWEKQWVIEAYRHLPYAFPTKSDTFPTV